MKVSLWRLAAYLFLAWVGFLLVMAVIGTLYPATFD